jgi:hypothetical protein
MRMIRKDRRDRDNHHKEVARDRENENDQKGQKR